jgi:4-hydroxymandelate synthase
MDVLGIDHVEIYVPDLEQARRFYVDQLGLTLSGWSRPLGDVNPGRSLSLRCGSTSVVLTAPTEPVTGDVADYLQDHGAGVANICLRITDIGRVWDDAVAGGAEPLGPPTRSLLNGTRATVAVVRAFGDVLLTLIERSDPTATRPFAFRPVEPPESLEAVRPRFEGIDHLAVCLPAGTLESTAALYTEALGFLRTFEERVTVGGQAMDSIVVQDPQGALVLTLLCQDPDHKPGQISRFVDAHGGAGVQHIAFRTGDILTEVARMRRTEVDFLTIPSSYYAYLLDDRHVDDQQVDPLERAGVLYDTDEWGVILQTFTRSVHPRNTLFFELVERRGARTFGSGNIRALYEAVGRVEPVDTSIAADEPA